MVTWQFLRSKRKLEIPAWLINQGLDTDSYESFCGILESLGVTPIARADYKSMFPVPTLKEIRVAARQKEQAEIREQKSAERKAARQVAQAEKALELAEKAEKVAERKAARLAESKPSQSSGARGRNKHQPKEEADV
jgi:hypothetical protein